jgi:hypothetical protein
MRIESLARTYRRHFAAQVAYQTLQSSNAQGLLGIGRNQGLYGVIDKSEPYFQFRESLLEGTHDHSGREMLRPRPIP